MYMKGRGEIKRKSREKRGGEQKEGERGIDRKERGIKRKSRGKRGNRSGNGAKKKREREN